MFEHATMVRLSLEEQREAMISYLRSKGFTARAAARAVTSYIDTKVFLALEDSQ